MTPDDKLAAILAAVQTDPGNRGLARDPADNLFAATRGDFAAACKSIAEPQSSLGVYTGFFIPTADPPSPETDGPLGAVFLFRALAPLNIDCVILAETFCRPALLAGLRKTGMTATWPVPLIERGPDGRPAYQQRNLFTHPIALERVGPAADSRCYTMRGIDVTDRMLPFHDDFRRDKTWSIGIGDGGNEIGMGKIPHETVVKNIPNGDLIHCRVPTDHLIVAGVSNWGAYALAAGVYVLRGVAPPPDLFDPDRERAVLEAMVREGPLVDGVTGKPTATVDGLSWDEYVKPFIRIREILEK